MLVTKLLLLMKHVHNCIKYLLTQKLILYTNIGMYIHKKSIAHIAT